jgi:hypothetical protein
MNESHREIQERMRDLVGMLDDLERENDRLEQQVEVLQAHIRRGKPAIKGLVIDALMAGRHTVEAISEFTGVHKDSLRNRLYELHRLGVIRRRGPYQVGKANAKFFYGRKLK